MYIQLLILLFIILNNALDINIFAREVLNTKFKLIILRLLINIQIQKFT